MKAIPSQSFLAAAVEGLLKTLSNDEVRDLIAYLLTTAQVPLQSAPTK